MINKAPIKVFHKNYENFSYLELMNSGIQCDSDIVRFLYVI
ncbi:hypothetical protein LLB_0258 [Legionella longbeachae D-4968]|nr:hypothetical protein LLB_0258 [Legionella longbeachae D-4968]